MQNKSSLQERAERAASLFPDVARKPIVIEFAGTPKAGKTTTLSQLNAFLKRCGFKVEVVIERASLCPIKDKKHVNFNIWTVCTTLSQILEKTQTPPRPDDPQILILDRGIFDSIFWLRLMERLQRIRPLERKVVEDFLLIPDWRDRVAGVILMSASPTDAMQREQGMLPVFEAKGSIMNEAVLKQMTDVVHQTEKDMESLFRVFSVNTSVGENKENPKRTVEKVAEIVLSLIEEHLKENILYIQKEDVKKIFDGSTTVGFDAAKELVTYFQASGIYAPRNNVEEDNQKVQAIPIVVIRNASGQVLRLRRREKSEKNPLHEKIVVWAGGHVRNEDNRTGQAILTCITRELEEELRLRVNSDNITLLGAIYIENNKSSSKHVAIVHEWKAPTDDVEVALSNAEFFERRGTSLSGKFVDLDEILKDMNIGKNEEEWSGYIIREFVAKDSKFIQRPLF